MSDIGLNMLGVDDEAAPERGAAPNTPVVPSGSAQVQTATDAMGQALGSLPEAVQLRIATIAARYGIDPRSDPVYALVEAVQIGADCTKAASASATAAASAVQAVQAGIGKIPRQIYDGAVKAGDEVKGALRQEIKDRAAEAGLALKAVIEDGAGKGAIALKNAADELDVKVGNIPDEIQAQIGAYKTKGIADFAKAAASAGRAAAEGSMWAKAAGSAMTMLIVFCIAAAIGAGGLWGYLLVEHRVMPDGFAAMSAPAGLGGGAVVSVPNGGEVMRQCNAGICLRFAQGLPTLP